MEYPDMETPHLESFQPKRLLTDAELEEFLALVMSTKIKSLGKILDLLMEVVS